MATELRVTCDPKYSWLENRNGIADLTGSDVWASTEGLVYVSGTGKRGGLLRGGLCITVQEMDELAKGWLKARNPGESGEHREEQ